MKKRTELSLTQKATQALADAVAKVVEDHRRRGRPLAIWRDGKAMWIQPAEVGALRETPSPYGRKGSRLHAEPDGAEQPPKDFIL